MAQNKATLRQALRSALSHRRLANEILDSFVDSQTQFNAAMDKLNADTALALDTDYAATTSITDVFEADTFGLPAQHKATLRESLRSALSHRKLADELADALEELQAAHNTLMAKLDAEAGTLNDTDYASLLALSAIAPDAEGTEAQHKASFRVSLQSALSHRRLANVLLDNMVSLQGSFNDALAQLDTGTINGVMAQFKVSVIDPDAA